MLRYAQPPPQGASNTGVGQARAGRGEGPEWGEQAREGGLTQRSRGSVSGSSASVTFPLCFPPHHPLLLRVRGCAWRRAGARGWKAVEMRAAKGATLRLWQSSSVAQAARTRDRIT